MAVTENWEELSAVAFVCAQRRDNGTVTTAP
jgi:hypothetical protein